MEGGKSKENPVQYISNDAMRKLVESLDQATELHKSFPLLRASSDNPPVVHCKRCVYSILKHLECNLTNVGGGILRCEGAERNGEGANEYWG